VPDDFEKSGKSRIERVSPIKVAIVEDARNIRDGLAILINGSEGYRCTGVFRSVEQALETIGLELPDVVLVDLGLPGMSGVEGIRIFSERHPSLLSIVLTVYNDNELVFDALCAGACGYLLKNTPPARLLESVEEAVKGGSPMSPEIARRVVALFREIRPPEKVDYQLTPYEMRLLRLLVEGHNYKTAATELSRSVNTISSHMRNIYRKLQVHSKSEAVSKALRNRLI
jgi:DNA-binding NarL/FixJ family response regulator